jgi:hypothetical protein
MRNHITGSNNVIVSSISPSSLYFSMNADTDTSTPPGSVRYNPNRNVLEVWNGSAWMLMADTLTTVGLSSEIENILGWARKKMTEEYKLQHLMSKYPALQNAHDQFQLVKHLVAEEKNNP